jgi:hypothetical protein
MSKKLKTYNIMAKLILDVDITIKADSLEDAISRSKELKEYDFVEFNGNFLDGSMTITGAFEE